MKLTYRTHSIDMEQFSQGPIWKDIRKAILIEVQDLKGQLEDGSNTLSNDQLRKLQGMIAAARRILHMPEILAEAIKAEEEELIKSRKIQNLNRTRTTGIAEEKEELI